MHGSMRPGRFVDRPLRHNMLGKWQVVAPPGVSACESCLACDALPSGAECVSGEIRGRDSQMSGGPDDKDVQTQKAACQTRW
jgi:hypothetical protein